MDKFELEVEEGLLPSPPSRAIAQVKKMRLATLIAAGVAFLILVLMIISIMMQVLAQLLP